MSFGQRLGQIHPEDAFVVLAVPKAGPEQVTGINWVWVILGAGIVSSFFAGGKIAKLITGKPAPRKNVKHRRR